MGENECRFGNKLKKRKNYFYESHVFMKKNTQIRGVYSRK